MKIFKQNLSKLTIGLLIIVCAWYGKNLDTWGKNQIIQNDVISYYAYLPATFIFHDLSFGFTKDLPENFEGKIWLQEAPTGKPILRMTMGLAILWIPFFLIGHALAFLSGASTLGYSWPYGLSVFLAAVFYLFTGLFYVRKILIRYFSDITVALTLLAIVAGTNLMYYIISEPGMSHVYNFALISAFLYYSILWTENGTLIRTIKLGLIAGMIVLIRPVNIIVILFPVLIGINGFSDFTSRLRNGWKAIIWFALAAFLVVLPQLIYWKIQTGHFLFNSYMESGKFYFLRPQIINGLFSYRKGWLLYTPIMFFAIAGLFMLKQFAKELKFPVILVFLINIYVIYSWWCWWYGGSFGSRPMIDMYGILALPMAAFFEWTRSKKIWIKGTAAILLVGFIFLNQFQMSQYRTSLLHWDSMTKEAYWGIFGKKNWPANYDKMIKIPDYEKALQGEREY